jgi:hypothetical protein
MTKVFKIPAERIRQIAVGKGGCIASDRITVDGKRVGFMYREPPEDDVDSGWRFMAGDESQEYMDDPNHLAIYDVNTIANYDADIVSLLDAPVGAAFERSDAGVFEAVDLQPPDEA